MPVYWFLNAVTRITSSDGPLGNGVDTVPTHSTLTTMHRNNGCVYYRALVHFEHLLSVLRALTLRNENNSVH